VAVGSFFWNFLILFSTLRLGVPGEAGKRWIKSIDISKTIITLAALAGDGGLRPISKKEVVSGPERLL
jgi:hypothetical protein